MTASDRKPCDGAPATAGIDSLPGAEILDRTCRTVVDGRRAARALARWCKQFGFSEPEFQLLWCLRASSSGGLDQSTVAGRLALSPAQVSTLVERLRAQGWIAQSHVPGDRRRHLWQLTSEGHALVMQMPTDARHLLHAECGKLSFNPQSAIRDPQSEQEAA